MNDYIDMRHFVKVESGLDMTQW